MNMKDWSQSALTKAKFVLTVLGIVGIVIGWAWSVFVIADDSKDALEKATKNEIAIDKGFREVDERLDSIETQIKVSNSEDKIRDEYNARKLEENARKLKEIEVYQTRQLDEIKVLLRANING